MAGQASISQTNPNTMTINQGTQRTVIDWNSFNVGTGNTVQFNQPNAQAQALNRVTGGIPSNIQGQLLANGQVLIQNANGVLFAKGSTVNVGALLATTKSIDAGQFMAGGAMDLKSTGKNASVVNEGAMNAAGYVVLAGDRVRNSGDINAANVVLAAGDSAIVALSNGQGISLKLTDATANALVENTGNINAGNGSVLLTGRGKDTLLNSVVNLSGVVKAGTVVADAGNTGDVAVRGKIDASGVNGGTVVLSGDRVGVFNGASIDASGQQDGGKVIVGGDSLHKIDAAPVGMQDGVNFASFTQVDAGASIKADAARGNGGFVETSGRNLNVQGVVSAAAPNGKAGAWLIDPTNVTISTAANANEAVSGGTFTPSTNAATVNNGAINTALNAGTDVTITTASAGTATGNIVQNAGADIIKSAGSAATLTMLADGSIQLNGNIKSTSDKLNLNLQADQSGLHKGSVTNVVGSAIDLNGGQLNVSANTTAGNGLDGGNNAVALLGTQSNIGGGTIAGAANTGAGVIVNNLAQIAGTLNVNATSNTGVGFQQKSGTMSFTNDAVANFTGTAGSHAVDFEANLVVDKTAKLNANGTSTSGVGVIRGGSGTLTIADAGAVKFTGQSQGSTGVGFWGTTSLSGNATLDAAGTSATGTGAQVNSGATVNLAGTSHARFNGVSTSGVGFKAGEMGATGLTNMTVGNSATLDMAGTAQTASGVYTGAINLLVKDNGIANLTGTSDTGMGVALAAVSPETGYNRGQYTTADAGTLNINGTSRTNVGVNDYGSPFTQTGTSIVNINAVSTDNTFIGFLSWRTMSVTDSATLNINASGSAGAWFAWSAVNASKDATVNVTGTGTTDNGVIAPTGSLSDNATMNINGTSQSAAGVYNGLAMTVSGDATLNEVGKSDTGAGVSIDSNMTATDNGAISISGASTDGTGVQQNSGSTVNVSGNGSVDIGGASQNGTGVNLAGNANVIEEGVLNVSGTSDAGVGVNVSGNVATQDDGKTVIDGTSSQGTGVNVAPTGTVTTSGEGSTVITGGSTNGNGAVIDGNVNVTDNGTANISGNSANGSGVIVDPNGSINISGNGAADISGNSTNGNGAVIDGNVNVTDNGTANISGGSTNGSGVIVDPNGSINTSGNGSTNISGDGGDAGVVINGSVDTSGNGTTDISGNAS
ncbi:filamentous hemagglutinin N-terminal domain-containing protein, partial [Paraburkholderia kirstenboschensis]|uniref:two-partner secretion domain-containing protein n=1 Tax=Paraburkholderia kirstenboschensis TaxID=1245436 RepID=UPI001FB2E440